MKRINLLGKKFGRLTVVAFAGRLSGTLRWDCVCDCGARKTVDGASLRSGNTKSCGCLQKEIATKNIKGQRRPFDDISGQKFGRLTAVKWCGGSYWECLCDCGNPCVSLASSLKNGNTRSCGCLAKEVRRQTGRNSRGRKSSRFVDLTGEKFGLLTVIERAENGNSGHVRWHCLCDCGRESIISSAHLRSGHSRSCGCLGLKHATEAKIKHGDTGKSLYSVFHGMHNRCEKSNVKEFKWYGAKGIKVCDEWSDYTKFRNWAYGNGYKEGLTIDRINPDGNYEPSNCRWITRSENSRRVKHRKN